MGRGKRYDDAAGGLDPDTLYGPAEAIEQVKNGAKAKFDETIELAARLGVDARQADQQVRGTVALPAGTGKDVRVAVFASGDKASAAREAGADVVGDDDLVEKVEGGDLDFDIAISTPELMPKVGKLGRVLGPRGLMPNPKSGTVTDDVAKAVSEFKGGKVEYRTDKGGNIHVTIGRASFTADQLLQNFQAIVDELMRVRPAVVKGRYVRKLAVSSTMGPSAKIDPAKLKDEADAA